MDADRSAVDSEAVKPPPNLFLLLETRAVTELLSTALYAPWLSHAPRGDGHPVMVLPGFVASDISTRPLRRFLKRQGFAARPWGFGRNLGLRENLEERMIARVRYLKRVYGRRVSLIGWSLGGVFAREVARAAPDAVRSVISLGSPFGHPKANRSWWLYNLLADQEIDDIDPARFVTMREPPPVPATAIYSRTDGIASWRSCLEQPGPTSENIEVEGSHCGLGCNPVVLYAIADRLAQAAGEWRPFDRSGWRKMVYREPYCAD